MNRIVAATLIAVAGAAGFVAGSWWHAELALEPPSGPKVAPICRAPDPRPCAQPLAAAALDPEPADPVDARSPDVGCLQTLDLVRSELERQHAEHAALEQQRTQREGAPIAATSRPQEPRFEPEALRTAVSSAFTDTKVPGRVDGLDCTEWPCIIYGRIRGTEDEMEKLEGAKALAAYEKDVLSVQLWVVTDEAATEAPLPILPGRPEQTLYAFAWYPRGLDRAFSENLDRRLRSRTADLWNTMSPSDETGR